MNITELTPTQKLQVLTTLKSDYEKEQAAAAAMWDKLSAQHTFAQRVAAITKGQLDVVNSLVKSYQLFIADLSTMIDEVNAGKL